MSPQQCPADGSQHVKPQAAGLLQQESPAHPLAGGLHGVSPHCVTLSAQTPVKQLPEQQSLSCAQAPPLTLPQPWSGQQTASAAHWAQTPAPWPQALWAVPAKQRPGWPGPFSQQPFGTPTWAQKAASHWHCWLAQWPWKRQIAQESPFLPQAPSPVPGWHWEVSSQQPAQQAPPGAPWQLRWSVRQVPVASQQPSGQVCAEQGPASH